MEQDPRECTAAGIDGRLTIVINQDHPGRRGSGYRTGTGGDTRLALRVS
jgi:hypothetical protein